MDLSYRGEKTAEFDRALSKFTGIKHVISTNSGTAALHLCMILAGVEPGDEVLVPAVTFVATANAVRYVGAIPHFLDSGKNDLNIDPCKIAEYLSGITHTGSDGYSYNTKTGRRIRAIVPVHVLGYPCNMGLIHMLSLRFNLKLIEDACQALGSRYEGGHVGAYGICGALSFNGNKIITTGGGGALLTNDTAIADRALYLSQVAKDYSRQQNYHGEVGYNYRMPALNAIHGLKELRKINKKLKANKARYNFYRRKYYSNEMIQRMDDLYHAQGIEPNFWRIPIHVDNLKKEGLTGQPLWTLLPKLPMYKNCPSMPLIHAEKYEQNVRFI